jgi:hypothetical protein
MAAACGASAVAVALVSPVDARSAILLGMAAPLAAAVATWIIVERAHRVSPSLVMPVLLRAAAAKAVFFAAYVVLVLEGLGVAPAPFAVSLAMYFILLLAVEAALFQRLFSRAWRAAR